MATLPPPAINPGISISKDYKRHKTKQTQKPRGWYVKYNERIMGPVTYFDLFDEKLWKIDCGRRTNTR